MKMFIFQHKLANYDLNSNPLNQICQDKDNPIPVIWQRFQLKFNYDWIIFNLQTTFDLIDAILGLWQAGPHVLYK